MGALFHSLFMVQGPALDIEFGLGVLHAFNRAPRIYKHLFDFGFIRIFVMAFMVLRLVAHAAAAPSHSCPLILGALQSGEQIKLQRLASAWWNENRPLLTTSPTSHPARSPRNLAMQPNVNVEPQPISHATHVLRATHGTSPSRARPRLHTKGKLLSSSTFLAAGRRGETVDPRRGRVVPHLRRPRPEPKGLPSAAHRRGPCLTQRAVTWVGRGPLVGPLTAPLLQG